MFTHKGNTKNQYKTTMNIKLGFFNYCILRKEIFILHKLI